ncbi:MAG: hypothetical protein B6U78_01940, partial [Candidatus Aenigmarchaeota archaeon ex4484_224]
KIKIKKVLKGYKERDTISEVFVIKPFSLLLAFLSLRVFGKKKKLPYLLTLLSTLFNILGIFFIFYDFHLSPLFFFLFFIFDHADGVVSRIIFGKDPEIRGTLDFLTDKLASISIFLIGYYLFLKGYTKEFILMMVFLLIEVLYLSFQSTKFRLFSELKITEKTKWKKFKIKGFLGKIWELTGKIGIYPYTSESDGHFIILVLLPLLPLSYSFFLILISILFSIPVFLAVVYLVYSLLKMVN